MPMPDSERAVRQTICEIGRRLYRYRYVVATEGNISYRFDDGHIVATPTGVCKGELTPDMLITLDIEGRVHGPGRPSTELPMHLFIYRRRSDVAAVVHAHPLHATAFATAGIPLNECVLPEVITTLGAIPLAAYATPSTQELPQSLEPYVDRYDAILLANHGAVTMGRDLWDAYFKMERLEQFAAVLYLARQLGGARPLGAAEVEKLMAIRQTYGLEGEVPMCALPALQGPSEDACACEHPHEGPPLGEFETIIEQVLAEVRPLLLKTS